MSLRREYDPAISFKKNMLMAAIQGLGMGLGLGFATDGVVLLLFWFGWLKF